MKRNLVVDKLYVFFKTARVILDDALFLDLISNDNYSIVVGVSHNNINLPENVSIREKSTLAVNINKAPEEILSSFHDTTRNEIRRTLDSKDFIFSLNDDNFDTAYRFNKRFRKIKKLEKRSKKFFASAMRYSAYYRNKQIAGITFYVSDRVLRIQNIYSVLTEDKEMRKIAGQASRRLIYEICLYGSQNEMKILDLASINTINKSKSGITQFKMSFGGNIIPEYTYTYKSRFIRLLKSS